MKAVTWQETEKIEVSEVPDPKIEQPTYEKFQKKQDGAFKVVFQPNGGA